MNRYLALVCVCLSIAQSSCDRSNFGNSTDIRSSPPEQPPTTGSPFTYRPCNSDLAIAINTPGAPVFPAGIWQGTSTNELLRITEPVTAFVLEDGQFRFVLDFYDDFVGRLTSVEQGYAGEGHGFSGGTQWSDGSLISVLNLSGSFAEGEIMAGDWALESGDVGCFALSYDATLYEQPSSLEQLSGSWIALDDWQLLWTLTVEPDGRFTWESPYDCNRSGQFALLDERYNLYEVQKTTIDCRPTAEPYVGIAYVKRWISGGVTESEGIFLVIDDGLNAFVLDFWR